MEKKSSTDARLETIISTLKTWTLCHDLTLPISHFDIPKFKRWINWHGFSNIHDGFDFAAYIDKSDRYVLGLPPKTNIRAIADGTVTQVCTSWGGGYATFINPKLSDSS